VRQHGTIDDPLASDHGGSTYEGGARHASARSTAASPSAASILLRCMRAPQVLAGFFVVCGAIAGWLVAGLLPPQPLPDELQPWRQDYRLERRASDPFLVSDGRWLRVPRLFADFDLHMDLELGPDMDLDLLVRQVEPRLVQGRIAPFQERFVALRLTTGREGPAWRTREEALFGERRLGASLAPGLPATVWVQGRGRLLRANVAGRWTDWCEAEDTEGMFALVAHGGNAVLQRLVIENRGVPAAWLRARWTWVGLGALAGGLLAAVAAWVGRVGWLPALLLGGMLAGSAAWRVHTGPLEPLRSPPPLALLLLLAAPTVLAASALAAAAARGAATRLVVLVVGVALWFTGLDVAGDQLRSDTRAVDAVFGPRAGSALSEALAGIVRGPFALHSPHDEQHGVFLLGGALLYGRLGPKTEHLEPLLAGTLRGRLGRPVPVVGLPTEEEHAHTQQQWQLFTRFYTGYRPRVLVLGVAQTEGDRDAAGARRAWPGTLEATLRAAQSHARAHGAALVLFTEHGLAEDLFAVLRAAATDGVPLVVAAAAEPASDVARRLADAIEPLLRE
jgi:hypothetical protein